MGGNLGLDFNHIDLWRSSIQALDSQMGLCGLPSPAAQRAMESEAAVLEHMLAADPCGALAFLQPSQAFEIESFFDSAVFVGSPLYYSGAPLQRCLEDDSTADYIMSDPDLVSYYQREQLRSSPVFDCFGVSSESDGEGALADPFINENSSNFSK
jgi:hypothetical protein